MLAKAYRNWKEEIGPHKIVKKLNFQGYVLTRHNILYRYKENEEVYLGERWECLNENNDIKEYIFRNEYIDDGTDFDVQYNYTQLSDTQNYCTVPNTITDYRKERLLYEEKGLTIYKQGFNRRFANVFLNDANKEHKLLLRALNALSKHQYLPKEISKAIRIRKELERCPTKRVYNKWRLVSVKNKKIVAELINRKLSNYRK